MVPVLSDPSHSQFQFQFYLDGATNESYVILASTNLVDWLPVSTNIAPALITDSLPANTSCRYYRALFQ